MGWIEPTRSIGDVNLPIRPIPYPNEQTWTFEADQVKGIVVTCDGFFSNRAFKDPESLARFLIDPKTVWTSSKKVLRQRERVLDWIKQRTVETSLQDVWCKDVVDSAETVLGFFLDDETIDPSCSILIDPVKACRLATATAILLESRDNCTIAWIPNLIKP